MRIVLDLQGAQTASASRGIGRYSLALAHAIVRNRGKHEIILVMNGMFPDSVKSIRASFAGILPQENICVWHAATSVAEVDTNNVWRRETAERIREAFISSLRPDIVHIMSLFEGFVDDAVTSIGLFDDSLPTTVSLYDLIPLMNPAHYLEPNQDYEQHYHRKIAHIKRASALLAISESSRLEGIEYLDFPSESVTNVSSAAEPHFRKLDISASEAEKFCKRLNIGNQFILCAGETDARKNVLALIQAYSQLPKKLRRSFQLVFAGKIPEGDIRNLQRSGEAVGLTSNELVFMGYLSDEDLVKAYNLCSLYVFPSWHEGFGLPALEAMSCGAAVIGANTSSLPEVIGNPDALFDPRSTKAIANKLEQALSNPKFRAELSAYGLKQSQKFSWDRSAKLAIKAFENCYAKHHQSSSNQQPPAAASVRRPKLAFVSPLPPEQTGIAFYSSELLSELMRHYEVTLVLTQAALHDPSAQANCPVRSPNWLRANAWKMDRVLYHFGNSPFHEHMFGLLEEVPGTVVLHDFFLSAVLAWQEECNIVRHAWVRALYHSHGYFAVQQRYKHKDAAKIKETYPCSLQVLENAQGVIVHSKTSQKLAARWFGEQVIRDWEIIPLMRTPTPSADKAKARKALGLGENDFVVCTFGFLDFTKLNHRLLSAWLSSKLAKNKHCTLIFVGENHGGDYGQEILQKIRKAGRDKARRIQITGWVDIATFHNYVTAADVGVQLRTLSRGETSASVLDCMNYGLPVIINDHGSMSDLPDDAVWKLQDNFGDTELKKALEALHSDSSLREKLGNAAQKLIHTIHAPRTCADQYRDAIERFHYLAQTGKHALIQSVAEVLDYHQLGAAEHLVVAQTLPKNQSAYRRQKRLLVDVSATSRTKLRTGIERVVRAILLEWIKAPPTDYRVEPVYLSDEGGRWHYRYANAYTLGLLDCPTDILLDEEVRATAGDVIIGLDWFGQGTIDAASYLDELHCSGVKIHFLVCDLLPILIPHVFPPGTSEGYARWLDTVTSYDDVICISETVAKDLSFWLSEEKREKTIPPRIHHIHLGADVENSSPSSGIPDDAENTLSALRKRPTFLMVGTIEPRKGHLQAIKAFEQLWAYEHDVNLVIVGKEGWTALPDEMRCSIPEIMERLQNNPNLGKRLFWLEGISDEYLHDIYHASECLIAASEGEGFGLPLIEAAQHNLPILARDIPVFREVAGKHAHYFEGNRPSQLAEAVKEWLQLFRDKKHPTSVDMVFGTWSETAARLGQLITTEDNLDTTGQVNLKEEMMHVDAI